jgi:uncharacterized protein YfaS (alpha-2-macroglobulin family)
VIVTTRTAVPVDGTALKPVDGLEIQRAITPAGSIDSNDRVRVTLRVTVPTTDDRGCWMVTETVPSGLRPIVSSGGSDDEEADEDGAGAIGPWSVEGQRVRWCVTRDAKGKQPEAITYLARVLTPGTYTWEPAVVQSALAPDRGMVLPATTVTVRGLTRD